MRTARPLFLSAALLLTCACSSSDGRWHNTSATTGTPTDPAVAAPGHGGDGPTCLLGTWTSSSDEYAELIHAEMEAEIHEHPDDDPPESAASLLAMRGGGGSLDYTFDSDRLTIEARDLTLLFNGVDPEEFGLEPIQGEPSWERFVTTGRIALKYTATGAGIAVQDSTSDALKTTVTVDFNGRQQSKSISVESRGIPFGSGTHTTYRCTEDTLTPDVNMSGGTHITLHRKN